MSERISGLSIRWTIFLSFSLVIALVAITSVINQAFIGASSKEIERVSATLETSARITELDTKIGELATDYNDLRLRMSEAANRITPQNATVNKRREAMTPLVGEKPDVHDLLATINELVRDVQSNTLADFKSLKDQDFKHFQSQRDSAVANLNFFTRQIAEMIKTHGLHDGGALSNEALAFEPTLEAKAKEAKLDLPIRGAYPTTEAWEAALQKFEEDNKFDLDDERTFLLDSQSTALYNLASDMFKITTVLEKPAPGNAETKEPARVKALSDMLTDLRKTSADLRKDKDQTLKAGMDKARESAKAPVFVAWLVLALTIAAVFLLSWWTSIKIARPLRHLVDVAQAVSEGDLTVELDCDRTDEIGDLVEAFDRMVSEMNEVIRQAQSVAEQVVESARVVTQSAGGVMEQMDHQAAGIANATRDVNDVKARSHMIQEHAGAATSASEQVQSHSRNGQQVVSQTKDEMSSISRKVKDSAEIINRLGEASSQIGAIVSTIGEIADQTNLLALNAAIEAARAGEHGRGFAVVADEVRKLAENVGRSADEIISMISSFRRETEKAVESMKQGAAVVERGVNYANSAGESLQTILTAVHSVTDMMVRTNDATDSQVQASENVSITLQELTDLSVIARDAAHKTNEEVQSMQQAAHRLQSLLSQFSLHAQKSRAGLSRIVHKANLR